VRFRIGVAERGERGVFGGKCPKLSKVLKWWNNEHADGDKLVGNEPRTEKKARPDTGGKTQVWRRRGMYVEGGKEQKGRRDGKENRG